jgi:hypothetical protein
LEQKSENPLIFQNVTTAEDYEQAIFDPNRSNETNFDRQKAAVYEPST